jgi:glycerol-3-phosphate acyltransferase PlsX
LTAQALDGLASPQVRLLNVGEEVSKGSEVIKATADLLSDEPLINYAGFVEGDGIFKGLADVVVCDGFTGNVALKSSEGVARMIGGMIRESMGSSWLSRLLSLFMAGTLRDLRRRLDPAAYNGAYLLGLTKVVVKSHGGADEQAFGHALDVAIEAAKRNLPKVLTPILQAKYQQQ